MTESEEAGRVENEDYVGAIIRFAGGAVGTLEVNRVIVGPALEMAFEVFSSLGSIRREQTLGVGQTGVSPSADTVNKSANERKICEYSASVRILTIWRF